MSRRHTFCASVISKPLNSESPAVKSTIIAFNDKRFALQDDMNEHQFLESFDALVVDHVAINAHYPLEVGGRLDELLDVEVRRDRLKGRARPRRRHLADVLSGPTQVVFSIQPLFGFRIANEAACNTASSWKRVGDDATGSQAQFEAGCRLLRKVMDCAREQGNV